MRWMARRWITSDVPPRQSSRRNFSWSSGAIRDSFFCTLSNTRIVARLVSRTTSNYGEEGRNGQPWGWSWGPQRRAWLAEGTLG